MKNTRLIIQTFLLLFFLACKKDKTEPIPQLKFETSEITDSRDGRKYKTVKIGEQWWMAENLNYYTSTGSWYYDNDSATNSGTYGRLYTWSTIMKEDSSSASNPSNVRGISPEGWHIPSDSEWTELTTFLSTNKLTGDDLKEVGTIHWKPTNSGTNKTLFNAVPAGTIFNNGTISANINGYATYLSSTIDTATSGVWGRGLDFDNSVVKRQPLGLQNGWTIRCVKDK